MKAYAPRKNRFLIQYIMFCLCFASILLILVWIGNRLAESHSHLHTNIEIFSQDSLPIVVIDAGHGGEDGGAVGTTGIYEKDINLKIAKSLDEMLRSMGVKTVMTRTEDILLYDRNSDYQGQKKVQDLATRRKIAEQYENAIFISIHMNSFPEEKYSGLQVYYSPNDQGSKLLAESIQSLTKEVLLTGNERKTKASGGNIYLLDRLECPAVLVECGFLSNPIECEKLSGEEYQQQMALALSLSIMEYFSQTGS